LQKAWTRWKITQQFTPGIYLERKDRPLGRPTYRWEDNIKMDLKDTGCDVVECFYVVWITVLRRAAVNTAMNLWTV
jgi:hypothetical protein